MPTSSFIPKYDSSKAELLDHVATTLPKYKGTLAISAEDLAPLQAVAVGFRYALNGLSRAQSYSHNWTALKNMLRDGDAVATEWPIATLMSDPIPHIVKSGIITRFSLLSVGLKHTKSIHPPLLMIYRSSARLTSSPQALGSRC